MPLSKYQSISVIEQAASRTKAEVEIEYRGVLAYVTLSDGQGPLVSLITDLAEAVGETSSDKEFVDEVRGCSQILDLHVGQVSGTAKNSGERSSA